jgi:hypothetical protein
MTRRIASLQCTSWHLHSCSLFHCHVACCAHRVHNDQTHALTRLPAPVKHMEGDALPIDWPEVVPGSSGALLPAAVYEASLTDDCLQVLFVSCRQQHEGPEECEPAAAVGSAIRFRVTEAMQPQSPGANRFNFLPHSHNVADVYTDNTARAFVSRGGALTSCLTYEVYTRRRPAARVCCADLTSLLHLFCCPGGVFFAQKKKENTTRHKSKRRTPAIPGCYG